MPNLRPTSPRGLHPTAAFTVAPKQHEDSFDCNALDQILTALEDGVLPSSESALGSVATPQTPVDVVISGGGLRGYFVTGACAILRRAGVPIGRISGASAGAWCAVFMACDLDVHTWARTYLTTRRLDASGLSLLAAYRQFAVDLLPDDAHVICTGKVSISVTFVGQFGGLSNRIISHFASRDDLINCCIASCQLPFVACHGFGQRFRGSLVMDGGFTNHTPLFTDKPDTDQLVFRLSFVPYPLSMAISPSDPCVEALIIRGAIEMRRFLAGGPSSAIQLHRIARDGHEVSPIAWRARVTAWAKCGLYYGAVVPMYTLHQIHDNIVVHKLLAGALAVSILTWLATKRR